MRNLFAEALYESGLENDKVCIVVADISPAGSMEKFREQFPERFINVGVSEQSMIGLCAGMALRGMRPFAYTIATFTIYRPFEFVRDDICYQNLPVTLVGMGSGIIYSTLGGTHHSQEDVAVMSALPNMQVLAPCDPVELAEATRYCAIDNQGPMYLRIGKAGEPRLTENAVDPFEFGKIRYLQKGSDVCIISYGPIMKMAVDVARRLEKDGKSVSIVSAHTIKPFDTDGVLKALNSHEEVYCIEEHSPIGGLAHRVKEVAWDNQVSCKLKTFSLKDEFIHLYGSYEQLQEAHGLSSDILYREIVANG